MNNFDLTAARTELTELDKEGLEITRRIDELEHELTGHRKTLGQYLDRRAEIVKAIVDSVQ